MVTCTGIPGHNGRFIVSPLVSVGFTQKVITVHPSRTYATARIGVLSGSLQWAVSLVYYTEDGTARGKHTSMTIVVQNLETVGLLRVLIFATLQLTWTTIQ